MDREKRDRLQAELRSAKRKVWDIERQLKAVELGGAVCACGESRCPCQHPLRIDDFAGCTEIADGGCDRCGVKLCGECDEYHEACALTG